MCTNAMGKSIVIGTGFFFQKGFNESKNVNLILESETTKRIVINTLDVKTTTTTARTKKGRGHKKHP